MLIINNWCGRTGNNILQLIRCIWVAIYYRHNKIHFIHNLFITNMISFPNIQNNNVIIKDNFFNINSYNLPDIPLYKMKELFQIYLKPIIKLDLNKNINKTDIYIHLRGGDIFSHNPHSAYVQPPLSYYKNIISKYDKCIMVYEDTKNVCVHPLINYKEKVNTFHKSLQEDIEHLCHCEQLAIGFGTFGLMIYIMNNNLKKLYIPDFYYDELPNRDFGKNIHIEVVSLPNYIKVREWKNTLEQRRLMLTY